MARPASASPTSRPACSRSAARSRGAGGSSSSSVPSASSSTARGLPFAAMAAVHAIPLAATTTADWIWAGVSLLVAIVAATLVNRLLARRGMKLAQAVARGELRPEVDTRLRYLRRLLVSGILGIGIAIALLQFGGLNKLAASLLASGAIAAAIIGFAARQTLANFVAGHHARDHPAAARRRLGDVRRPVRRGRGRAPELHGAAHAGGRAAADPQREARVGDHPQRHADQPPDRARRGALAAARLRRRARGRRARRGDRRRRSRSPRRRPRASGSRSAANRWRRPSGRATRPRCACAACGACRPKDCSHRTGIRSVQGETAPGLH